MGCYTTLGGHLRLLGGGQHTAERSDVGGGAERRRFYCGAVFGADAAMVDTDERAWQRWTGAI